MAHKTENSVKKIQQYSKYGRIISLIGKIFSSIILGILLIVTILYATIGSPIVETQVTGEAQVEVSIKDSFVTDLIPFERINYELEVLEDEELQLNLDEVTKEGNITKVLLSSDLETDFPFLNFYKILVIPFVYSLLMLINFVFLHKLFTQLEKGRTPFSAQTIDDMKKVGYSLIPWVFFDIIADAIYSLMISNRLDLNFGINVTALIIIIIVFLLVNIFEYGINLQTEVDELV